VNGVDLCSGGGGDCQLVELAQGRAGGREGNTGIKGNRYGDPPGFQGGAGWEESYTRLESRTGQMEGPWETVKIFFRQGEPGAKELHPVWNRMNQNVVTKNANQ